MLASSRGARHSPCELRGVVDASSAPRNRHGMSGSSSFNVLPRRERRSTASRAALVLLLFLLAGLAYLLWSNWDREALLAWKRQAGPLRYFIAMTLLPMLGVPSAPFFMVAGALFGVRTGIFGSALALTAHLALCYRLSAFAWRTPFASRLRALQLPDFRANAEGALRFALIVKSAPGLPGAAKNYMLGLAGVPFRLYLLVGLAINGTFGVALLLLGDSLFAHDGPHVIASVLALALALAGIGWWRRRRRRSQSQGPSRESSIAPDR